MADINGKTIAFLAAAEGIERVELTEPWSAVVEAGGSPVLLSPEEGDVQTVDHLDKAETLPVDKAVPSVAAGAVLRVVALPGCGPVHQRHRPRTGRHDARAQRPRVTSAPPSDSRQTRPQGLATRSTTYA